MYNISDIDEILSEFLMIEGTFKIKDKTLIYNEDYYINFGGLDEIIIKEGIIYTEHKVDRDGEWYCKLLFKVCIDGDGSGHTWNYLTLVDSEYMFIQTFEARKRNDRLDDLNIFI
jgi:hypothetical protein